MLSGSARYAAVRLLPLLALAVTLALPIPVAALADSGNGEVQVRVCHDMSEDLVVHSPRDGEKLSSRETVVKGSVLNLSKVEIFVQDVQRASLKLGETAVGFEYPLALDTGSQTIKVVGYDLCGKAFHTVSLTVEVKAPPVTAGGGTSGPKPKTVDSPAIAGAPVIYHDAVSDVAEKTKIDFSGPGQPGAGTAESDRSLFERLVGWLDLGPTFADPGNIIRAVIAVVGAFLVINAKIAWRLIESRLGNGRSGRPKGSKRRAAPTHMYPHVRHYLRIVGVLMLLSLFVV